MYLNGRALGIKSIRNKSLIRLLKSPAIMAGSLKEPKTRLLSSNPNELCDRIKLLLQMKEAGNNCNIINGKIIAKLKNC